MKLVNEKGKLFGVINIVDLLALLLIIFVAAAVVWQIFGNRIAENNEARREQEELDELLNNRVKVTYTVRCSTLREDYYDGLCAFGFPQQLAVNDGVVDGAYIVSAYSEPTLAVIASDDGTASSTQYGDRVDIVVTIEALVPPTEFIKVGSQEIRVGKSHIVKTQFWEITGIVESLECDAQPFITAGESAVVLPDLG